jgi:hypothetical protein
MSPSHILTGDEVSHLDDLEPEKNFQKKHLLFSLDELEELVRGNEILEELLEDMLASCLHYVQTVADFTYELNQCDGGVSSEEFKEVSAKRGAIHDTMISSVRILCRTLIKFGKECNLSTQMGENRGAYGRYALMLTFSRLERITPNQTSP